MGLREKAKIYRMTASNSTSIEEYADPFMIMLSILNSETEKAKTSGYGVVLSMIRISNFSDFIKLYGAEEIYSSFDKALSELKKSFEADIKVIHYNSNKALIIIPDNINAVINDINGKISDVFNRIFYYNDITPAVNILSAKYPDNSDNIFSILNLIE